MQEIMCGLDTYVELAKETDRMSVSMDKQWPRLREDAEKYAVLALEAYSLLSAKRSSSISIGRCLGACRADARQLRPRRS